MWGKYNEKCTTTNWFSFISLCPYSEVSFVLYNQFQIKLIWWIDEVRWRKVGENSFFEWGYHYFILAQFSRSYCQWKPKLYGLSTYSGWKGGRRVILKISIFRSLKTCYKHFSPYRIFIFISRLKIMCLARYKPKSIKSGKYA